jgi:hypothetical protein
MTNFAEIQMKTLEVQETCTSKDQYAARAKEIVPKEKELDATLLTEENQIITTGLSLLSSKRGFGL